MKKLFLSTLLLVVCASAFAQFEKGRILAGGSISFAANTNKTKTNSATNTDGKTTTLGFNPKAGYFFIDNLAAGLGMDISSSSFKSEGSGNKDVQSSFSLSPFVRYYIEPGIFFQGTFGAGSGKFEDQTGNVTVTTKYALTNWSLGAGYAYFIKNNVAIEPFVGYGSTIFKEKSTEVKDISSGLFINIGLQIYLGGAK